MLGYVAMDVAPPYQTALGGVSSGYLSPGFPWCDWLSGVGRFSDVVPPGEWFVSSCGFLAHRANCNLAF
jgi:hypothetical protein